jgi:hypothetical protein
VSTAAIHLTQTPLCEAVLGCKLTQTHSIPTRERLGRINRTLLEDISVLWYEICMSSTLCFILRNMLHIFSSPFITGEFE